MITLFLCLFDEMMSTKTNSLVFGHVRENYRLYIPEVIVERCLLYFDPEVVIKFKGKDFDKFLEAPNGRCYKQEIKFNQKLSFTLQIHPNGATEKWKGYVGSLLTAECSAPILIILQYVIRYYVLKHNHLSYHL